MHKRPIIIDCDTGTDDAIALIAALGCDQLDIKAFTTVSGNVDLEYTSVNTLNLVRQLGFSAPVAKGADTPLVRDVSFLRKSESDEILPTHGYNGMGSIVLEKTSDPFAKLNAVQLIYEQAVLHQGELEIVAIGPQTNIALALKTYPELSNGLIKRIYFMGGAIDGGNSTAVAEFNVFFDPESTRIVLRSGIELIMVGLDVTQKALLSDKDCAVIRDIGTPAATLTADILDFMRMRRDKYNGEDVIMHDALTIAIICKPEMFTIKPFFVDVECSGQYTFGHTYVQKNTRLSNNPNNCNVATDIDCGKFVNWLTDTVKNCNSNL